GPRSGEPLRQAPQEAVALQLVPEEPPADLAGERLHALDRLLGDLWRRAELAERRPPEPRHERADVARDGGGAARSALAVEETRDLRGEDRRPLAERFTARRARPLVGEEPREPQEPNLEVPGGEGGGNAGLERV